jgi:hypothetical protein
MSDKTDKALTRTQREAHKAFSTRKAVITEYDKAQETFRRIARALAILHDLGRATNRGTQ